jgi:hypothetical protein
MRDSGLPFELCRVALEVDDDWARCGADSGAGLMLGLMLRLMLLLI